MVNAPKYAIGFDGNSIWKIEEVPNSFKGNKDFYYNLYFYFYAMPFVLADEGIIYSEADSLIFDNKKYPGIKIAFKNDVGTSPDDNYILYYHPETYQMEWLAYTVTFRSKKPSDKYNLIRYNDWAKTEGLLLPKSIVWYKKGENGQPEEPARSPVKFTLPLVSKTKLEDSFFEKPKE